MVRMTGMSLEAGCREATIAAMVRILKLGFEFLNQRSGKRPFYLFGGCEELFTVQGRIALRIALFSRVEVQAGVGVEIHELRKIQ